ncbi:MAG: DNA-binding protein [Woeseiaceae bacterium]|nr:DNA-binding protein [Woeseiaceae bacterium]
MTAAQSSDTRTATREAADQLLAEGIKPSVKLIRERLGRGSDTTIASALKEWWQELAERLFEQQGRPEVPEPLWEAVNSLWSAALEAAGKTFDAERESVEMARDKALEERDAALLARDQVRREAADVAERLTAAETSTTESRQHLAAEMARVEELRRELKVAEQALTDANSRYAKQLDEIRGQLELAEHRYERLEQRSAKEIDSARQDRDKAHTDLAAVRQHWKETEAQLRDQLSETRQLLARTEQRASNAEATLLQREDDIKQLRQRSMQLESQVLNLKAERDRALTEREALDEELRITHSDLQQRKEQLAAAEALLEDRRQKRHRGEP